MACTDGARRRPRMRPCASWRAWAVRTRRGLGHVALVLVHGGYEQVQGTEGVALDMVDKRGGRRVIISMVGWQKCHGMVAFMHKGKVQRVREMQHEGLRDARVV